MTFQSDVNNYWNSPNQLTETNKLGIPIGTGVANTDDIAYVANMSNKGFGSVS